MQLNNPSIAEHICKSFIDNDLEKAEGSRGGNIIGHTKSGKPIYEDHLHPSHKNFTKEEHREAAHVNEKAAKEEHSNYIRGGRGKPANWHLTQSKRFKQHAEYHHDKADNL